MKARLKFSIEQSTNGYQVIFETPGKQVSRSRVFRTISEALRKLADAVEGLEQLDGLTITGISNAAGERLST